MNTKTQSSFSLMGNPILLAGLLLLLLSACTPASAATNPPTATGMPTQMPTLPTTVPGTAMPTVKLPSDPGTVFTFGPLSLVIPPEVASGAGGREYPRVDSEDAAWWQKTPGHLQIMLGDYYVLQGKAHQPQIYVYPAQAYAELVPPAFESLHRLNNILALPDLPKGVEQLPKVPFFNNKPVFASNIRTISFRNGAGVRFLTEYAQSASPVNNLGLFYHFQGVTRDGAYYIIAIFPITAPGLAETGDAAAVPPSGGVPYPDITDPQADWPGYYRAMTDLLDGTSADAFFPALDQLDMLIESMQISPK